MTPCLCVTGQPVETYYQPPLPSASGITNFDSQELDQYFPDSKSSRAAQQQANYCPVSGVDSQPEYATLQQATYVSCNFQSNYAGQHEEQGYYTQPVDNSWLSQTSWLKDY